MTWGAPEAKPFASYKLNGTENKYRKDDPPCRIFPPA